jgi:hypothetical protein
MLWRPWVGIVLYENFLIEAFSASACVTTDPPAPADDPFPANYRALIAAHVRDNRFNAVLDGWGNL